MLFPITNEGNEIVFKIKYVVNCLILSSLLCWGCSNANSRTLTTLSQNQPQLSVNGDCKVSLDSKTNEVKLVSKITVSAQSRARCIIRIKSLNTQKQFRLVPLALRGTVKKAPATVAISSILIGDPPTRTAKKYTSPTKFDLTNQIPKTSYTTKEKSVLGINLILTTNGGELELTDMRFALQQR